MEIKTVESIEISGNMESTKAGIDESSSQFMFEMLSNLYTNPIAAIVREYTSNCFDSHIEAKVDDAVIVKKSYEEEGWCISFIDVGVGLSPKRMMKVFMNYFSSTKRKTNNLIGGFGLGSKSGLSYTTFFYINTVFNGLEYNYIYSKGEVEPELISINGLHPEKLLIKYYKKIRIETLDDYFYLPVVNVKAYDNPIGLPTDKKNGTTIKIVMGTYSDQMKFEREVKLQLCYFDNVYFEGWNINNEYTIYEKKYFRYRSDYQYSNEMHLLLGKVAYPIDWEILEINRIEIPIGVKFDIGELIVTPNRESLRYTDEVKASVKTRIKLAHDELLSMYEEERMEYDDFWEWLEEKDERKKIKFSEEHILYLKGERDLAATYYKGFKDYKFQKKAFKQFNLSHFGFRAIGQFRDGKLHDRSKLSNLTYTLTNGTNQDSLVLCENHIFREDKNRFYDHKQAILKETFNLKYLYNQYFHNTFSDYDYTDDDYNKPLGMPTGWGKQVYDFYKEIQRLTLLKINHHYSDDLSAEFIEQFKREKREKDAALQRKLTGKVLVKSFTSINCYNDKEWKMSEIEKKTNIVVYGFRHEKKELQNGIKILLTNEAFRDEDDKTDLAQIKKFKKHGLSKIEYYFSPCEVIQIAQSNAKYFKNKPNMLHISELKGDNIVFRKLATALKAKETLDGLLGSSKTSEELSRINRVIGKKLEIVEKFRKNILNYDNRIDSELSNSILKIARENNLFYPVIDILINEINQYFSVVELIKHVTLNSKTLPVIVNILYKNKRRLNFEYYIKYVEIPVMEKKESQLYIEFKEEVEELPTITKYEAIIEALEVA